MQKRHVLIKFLNVHLLDPRFNVLVGYDLMELFFKFREGPVNALPL